MSNNQLTVTITEKSRILKYAKGADPTKDKPFEIVEGVPVVLTGEKAAALLTKLRLAPDDFKQHTTSQKRRVIFDGNDQRIEKLPSIMDGRR